MKNATICVEASAAHLTVDTHGIFRSTMGLRVGWGHDQREYQVEVEGLEVEMKMNRNSINSIQLKTFFVENTFSTIIPSP